jgi:hypothetical protein
VLLPWVDPTYFGTDEISSVASDHGHTVDKGCRGDTRCLISAHQYPTGKYDQKAVLQPFDIDCTLRWAASLNAHDADFDFVDRDHGNMLQS